MENALDSVEEAKAEMKECHVDEKNGLSYRTLCIKRQEAGNIVGKEGNCEKKTGKSAN